MKTNNFNDNFWLTGNGKDFIEWSGINAEAGNYDTQLFYEYDKDIDLIAQNWLQTGDFKSIMRSLHSGSAENLPADYLELKTELELVPDWLDADLLRAGCELAERSALTGLLVLRNFALLGGYNFANLTKPLVATGSLEKGSVHRLYNTLDFWVNVSRTGKDSQDKRINSCLRTRLVHSASRLMIEEKQPDWDSDKYGIPINYADMIATNIAFTVYFLYGLDKLNFKYSEAEEQGTFHLWKYVTYLLGVPVEHIPANKEESLRFFKFWTKYQNPPDEDSHKLAASLLEENTPVSLMVLDVIKRNMGYIHRSFANYLIDDDIRRNLNISEARFKNIIISALKVRNAVPLRKEDQMKIGNAEQVSVLKDYKNNIGNTHGKHR